MKPYFQGEKLWPAGHRELQLYLTPDLTRDEDLANLILGCRDVLTQFPATDIPLPDECLHVTVQPIRTTPASTTANRDALVTELAPVLARLPAFTMLMGSPMAYFGGVVLDCHDDEPFNTMIDIVRPRIAAICGSGAVTHEARPAHMSLAYARSVQESDPVQRKLRRVRPSHAPLTVDAVQLVETEQVPEHGLFRSKVLHAFPLAQSAPT